MTVYIKAGHGFDVGQDFTRVMVDTLLQIDVIRGQRVYGWIDGNPNHKLGFMRAQRVRVCVSRSSLEFC